MVVEVKPQEVKELESLIIFWKDGLAQHRLLMSPSTIYLVEQTINRLEELKEIKEGEIVELNEDQASLFQEGS